MSPYTFRPNSETSDVAKYLAQRDQYNSFRGKYDNDNVCSTGRRSDIYVVQGRVNFDMGEPRREARLQTWWLLLSLASCVLALIAGLLLAPRHQHSAYQLRPALITNGPGASSSTQGDPHATVYYAAPRPRTFNVFPTVSSSDAAAMHTLTLVNETLSALGQELLFSLADLGFKVGMRPDSLDKEMAKLPENLRVLGQLADRSLKRSLLGTQWLQTQSRITPSSRWITEAEQYRNDTGHYEKLPWWCQLTIGGPNSYCMDAAAKAHKDIRSRLRMLRRSVVGASAEMVIIVDIDSHEKVTATVKGAREQTCGQADRFTRLFDKLARGIATWQSRYQKPAHKMVRIMPSIEHVGRDGVPDAWYILAHNKTDIVPTGADMCVAVEDLPELRTTALALAQRARSMCSSFNSVAERLRVVLEEKIPVYRDFLANEKILVSEWAKRLQAEGHGGFQGAAGIELTNWFETQIGASTLRWEQAIEAFH